MAVRHLTFHMWQGSIMTVPFRGRHSIWWCWRMTPVAHRIVNDVSSATRILAGAVFGEFGHWQLLLRLLYMTFHMRQGLIMRIIFPGKHSIWYVGGWHQLVLVMQLRAATKQTDANSVRVIREKVRSNQKVGSGCRKRFYRHMFFWFIHRLPLETSGTASCGTTFVHIHSIIGKIGQLV